MPFDNEYFDLGRLDALSYKDTFVHRLDPRTKLICVVAFIITILSFPKYEVYGLLPFFAMPMLLFTLGDIPFVFVMKKVLLVSPFAVMIGVFNPLLDPNVFEAGGVRISAGWISLLSILIRFILTISSALLLVATTSFPGICRALQRLGLPEIFTSQLLFLYRYIFVLTEEAMKMVRARDMRSFGSRGRGIRVFIGVVGSLLIRTIERAEKIYQAMLSRGFAGRIHTSRQTVFTPADAVFIALTAAFLYLFRMYEITGVGL